MKYFEKQSAPGMAANVCENLKSLGINVNFVTNKEEIKKTRYVDQRSNQQVMRLDTEPQLEPLKQHQIIMAAMHQNYDAIVVSDYNKGFVDLNLIKDLARKNPDVKVFIDTKSTTPPRRDNIIYKINQKEFEALREDHIPRSSNCIVTMGANGALWNKKQFQVPVARTFDVTGAGDTFLAALVFYYVQLDSMEESIAFANKAAAIAVENPGTYTLTMEDVDEILR
tara:strand:- start:392 stop:1066 length:675 start_codon:yes stop_codon:yes gene_type:complete